jgi:hypothetical protein
MESFMDAPVGVLAEEAGDAELLFAPHHVQSIPVSRPGGNRGAKHFAGDYIQRDKITPNALTVAAAPPYSALGASVERVVLRRGFGRVSEAAQSRERLCCAESVLH